MTYETITASSENGIARITLSRPDRFNCFNLTMHRELRDAIAAVRTASGVRVLLLTGAGKAFCAGQDLAERVVRAGEKPVDLGESVEKNWAPLVLSLKTLPLPVVVAVNGVAAGAGANLALAGDIVLATRSASFIEPFCRLGLIPDTGGTWALPRLVGTARALGLAMLGDKLPAQQAAEWGLIWRCVDDANFREEVEALVQHLATAPTLGLARTKKLILDATALDLDEALKREAAAMRELGFSRDYAEGVRAFLDKRSANFVGS